MARQLMLEKRAFWTGVTWFQISGDLAGYLNFPQRFALAAEEVAKRSPAEVVGLRPSRTIGKIEGKGRSGDEMTFKVFAAVASSS